MMTSDIGPAGRWICQTCGFQLTTAILRASDGAVGVNRRPVEDICPNDGTSLRPITWEEDAADANRVALEQMKRADDLEAQLTARAQEIEQVKAALKALRIDANRLCDRNLGGTYEEDCRRSLQAADAALVSRAPQQEQDDYAEAKRYLTALFARVAPQCEPLPTLSGLATQIDNYIAGLRAAPLHASAALPALIARVVQAVAELPDRTSPDDWPEAMLVTSDELSAILAAALSRADQP